MRVFDQIRDPEILITLHSQSWKVRDINFGQELEEFLLVVEQHCCYLFQASLVHHHAKFVLEATPNQ